MSESASLSAGIAKRYATAVFDIARENGQIEQLEKDVDQIDALLAESADFRELIHSPVYSRDQQQTGVRAVAEKIGLGDTTKNTLQLMAAKRRLFATREMVKALRAQIADAKGETTAEVISAKPLSDAQRDKLVETLKSRMGRDIKMTVAVDETLIGGLIVKVGSKMIDTSIRSKLNAMQNTMKEVG